MRTASLTFVDPVPALKAHCWICAKYAQCSCSDCHAAPSPDVAVAVGFAQVVGGGVVKIPATIPESGDVRDATDAQGLTR